MLGTAAVVGGSCSPGANSAATAPPRTDDPEPGKGGAPGTGGRTGAGQGGNAGSSSSEAGTGGSARMPNDASQVDPPVVKTDAATGEEPKPDASAPADAMVTGDGGGDRGSDAAPAASITVLAGGDLTASWGEQAKVANLIGTLMKDKPVAAVLTLGDYAYDDNEMNSSTREFNLYYKPSWGKPEILAITHPALGNHEYDVPNAKDYFDFFNGPGKDMGPAGPRGKGYYSFDLGAWHFIALNTNDACGKVACDASSAQIAWLKADLEANKAKCTVAYMHHPRFNEGLVHKSEGGFVKPIWDTLYDGGVDVVLTGHEHSYQQFKPAEKNGKLDLEKGMRLFIQGAGGADIFSEGFDKSQAAIHDYNQNKPDGFGVLELTLNADTYSWRFVSLNPTVMASGQDKCH